MLKSIEIGMIVRIDNISETRANHAIGDIGTIVRIETFLMHRTLALVRVQERGNTQQYYATQLSEYDFDIKG
jgi:hypothetical protein